MTFIINPIKRLKQKIKDKTYDTARALARIAYTVVPTATYLATSEKINEINNMPFIKKWLAYFFYNGDIEKLAQLNDYSAKGIGIAGGLLLGHSIDRSTSHILPNSQNLRKFSQILGYFGTANLVNLIFNGFNRTEEIKNTPALETILTNAKDTINLAANTAQNITQLNCNSELEYMASAGIMALTGITALKLGDGVIRSTPVQKTYNFIKNIYNYTIGKEDDAYKHRLANKIQIKKSKKAINNS